MSQRLIVAVLLLLCACQKREPLTAAKADEILRGYMFNVEPVYAEVPQKVWWNARAPKDDFDEKSLRTLENLRKAGYLTVTVASATAWSVAAVIGVPGQSTGWAAALVDGLPDGLVPHGPFAPGGALTVTYLPGGAA